MNENYRAIIGKIDISSFSKEDIPLLRSATLSGFSEFILRLLNLIAHLFTKAITDLLAANKEALDFLELQIKAEQVSFENPGLPYVIQAGRIDLVASKLNLKSLKYDQISDCMHKLGDSSTLVEDFESLYRLLPTKVDRVLQKVIAKVSPTSANSSLNDRIKLLQEISNLDNRNVFQQFEELYSTKSRLYKDLSYLQQIKNRAMENLGLIDLSQELSTLSPETLSLFSIEAFRQDPVTTLDKVIREITSIQIQSIDKIAKNILKERKSDLFVYEASAAKMLNKISIDKLSQPINVTMVGVEFAGLIKEGGLAEALEGLTKSIKAYNNENSVRLIFPKFSTLPASIKEKLNSTLPETHFDANGNEYAVYRTVIGEIEYLFIDDSSFELTGEKPSIYGPTDEAVKKRFTTFSSLAAELLKDLQEQGEIGKDDIIHLHDWHVAGTLIKLVNDDPEKWASGETPRLVFTYHNNNRAAQGRLFAGGPYNYDAVIVGLQQAGIIGENANLFVECLKKADAVTTVSDSFALESQTLELGEGVSFAVRQAASQGKVVGIVNGSIPERWNPETDPMLKNWKDVNTAESHDLTYGPSSTNLIASRNRIKEQLGKWIEKYFPEVHIDTTKPIITYVGRFDTHQKGIDKLEEAIKATLANGGQFICMGSMEDPQATQLLDHLQSKYTEGVLFIRDYKDPNGKFHYQQGGSVLSNGETLTGIGSVVRGSSDFIFIPSRFEPCGLVQFEGWLFGSLAIASKTGGLADTVISHQNNPEQFNGFHFFRDGSEGRSAKKIIKEALGIWNQSSDDEKNQIIARLIQDGRKCSWSTSPDGLAPVEKYLLTYALADKNANARSIYNRSVVSLDSYRRVYQEAWITNLSHTDKAGKREEEYLNAYYNDLLDSEELEKLYIAIPHHRRIQLPTPYGKNVESHLYLNQGAKLQDEGTTFTVHAPNAPSVSVRIAENDCFKEITMTRGEQGIWSIFVPGILEGAKYQYLIGDVIKMDPLGLECAKRENEIAPYSVVINQNAYQWNDAQWIKSRSENRSGPLSSLEVHPTTWKKNNGQPLNYRELGRELVIHCKKLGFTHVELMGLLDHPSEESWGYQVTSFFAPNARLGSAEDLKFMIDYLHENGIGVILDWTPAHFANDLWALNKFDVSNLFQHGLAWARRLAFNWGTKFFDYSHKSVREFLISSAAYWIEEMHIDALRVDAVRCIRTSEDAKGMLFMKDLNAVIHRDYPGVLTIAEDYSGDIDTTLATHLNGLGFDMEWNICWMKKTLEYFRLSPEKRKSHYSTLIESITGNTFHKMVMAFSHDEVKSGMKSLLNKTEDLSEEEKYANLRAMLSFMMCLPGKKLMFAGCEFGSSEEWNTFIGKSLGIMDDPSSKKLEAEQIMEMMSQFNKLYRNNGAFWVHDDNANDLEWIEKEDPSGRICAYRRSCDPTDVYACFHNFSDTEVLEYEVELPERFDMYTSLDEVINTDRPEFGGKGQTNSSIAIFQNTNGKFCYKISIPPLSTVVINELND